MCAIQLLHKSGIDLIVGIDAESEGGGVWRFIPTLHSGGEVYGYIPGCHKTKESAMNEVFKNYDVLTRTLDLRGWE
jgi:cation diffusion facilitator CzcD-associated flavoprotein CzcO